MSLPRVSYFIINPCSTCRTCRTRLICHYMSPTVLHVRGVNVSCSTGFYIINHTCTHLYYMYAPRITE